MNTAVFRFSFSPGVDLTEAEATLQLAILASEGLFGEARGGPIHPHFPHSTHGDTRT